MAQEPSTTRRARALELLKATLATPSWLPTTKAKRLVWAIRGATVLGLLVLIASVVDKNLWDWLDLLIIPAVLAAGALLFNRSENRRAERQVKLDREIALGHRHDDALQAYLDRISQLLTTKESPLDEAEKAKTAEHLSTVSTVARAWTLTVLETLTVPETLDVDVEDSSRRKRRVVRFLYEANLIGKKEDDKEIARVVNLSRASLVDADLSGANLRGVDLRGADLGEAILTGTDLRDADLRHARTRDKKDKKVTTLVDLDNVALAQKGPALEGATMPNCLIYEKWIDQLKEKERCEDLTSDEKDYLDQLKKGEMNSEPS